MPFASVLGAAVVSGVASYAASSAEGSANKKIAKDKAKYDFQTKKYELDYEHHNKLEDRLYKEQAIGSYRPYAAAGLTSPEYTNVGAAPVDPYAPKR